MGTFPHPGLPAHGFMLMTPHVATTVANQKSLFLWKQNSRQFLEKAITLEQEGIFTIVTLCELSIIWQIVWWLVYYCRLCSFREH